MNLLLDFARFYIYGNKRKDLENQIKLYSIISSKKPLQRIQVDGSDPTFLEDILNSAEYKSGKYIHNGILNSMEQINNIPKPRRLVEKFSYWLGYKQRKTLLSY